MVMPIQRSLETFTIAIIKNNWEENFSQVTLVTITIFIYTTRDSRKRTPTA